MQSRRFWFGRAPCVAVMCMFLASVASADVTTDLWDVSQGSVVTGFWPSAVYLGSDIRDMFGGEFGTLETGSTVFPDAGWLPGNSVTVEWKTPSVVELGRFALSVAADGNWPTTYNRAIRGFKLYAGDGQPPNWNLIYDSGLLTAPLGEQINGVYHFTIDHTFASPVSSMSFKAEFVCDTTTGPRVIELDGYAVPEPASLTLLALGGLAAIHRRTRQAWNSSR